jgi:uncharacterized membrane protein SirB2
MTYLASSVLGLMILVHLATFKTEQKSLLERTQLVVIYASRCVILMRSGGHHASSPAMVAPPASSACLTQDPTGLVELIQYQTPLSL